MTPAKTENNPHRSTTQKITCTGDNSFMVMSSEGVVSFWSPTGELKRIKREIVKEIKIKYLKKL